MVSSAFLGAVAGGRGSGPRKSPSRQVDRSRGPPVGRVAVDIELSNSFSVMASNLDRLWMFGSDFIAAQDDILAGLIYDAHGARVRSSLWFIF